LHANACKQTMSKLLLLTTNFWPEPTGIAVYTTDLANILTKDGHEVAVLTSLPHYPWWRIPEEFKHMGPGQSENGGVRVIRARHIVPSTMNVVQRMRFEFSLWFNLLKVSKKFGAEEFDLVIACIPTVAAGIVAKSIATRMKIPFGIAQIGKAFRNEIVARQFIFRMREFEQMEMQFFVKPGEELTWYEHWKEARKKWHLNLGMGEGNYRFHDHIKLAHYANAACDIEFNFPMGFKELEGIHSRTDFDLKQHEVHSGKKLQYFDPATNESYVPFVIETSVGLDRLFLSVLTSSYQEEKLEDGSERTVLKIPAVLAPYKIAILPLVKKDGLPEKAQEIVEMLRFDFTTQYDEKDSIGKRYRRQDAIGTPFAITVDHETLENQTVTIRNRDTMIQERIAIDALPSYLNTFCSWNAWLKPLMNPA